MVVVAIGAAIGAVPSPDASSGRRMLDICICISCLRVSKPMRETYPQDSSPLP
jgi:hypothetical protein